MQPSRRAFLLGRPTPRTPWQAFGDRLRRLCAGDFERVAGVEADAGNRDEEAGRGQPPGLRWAPADGADVRVARSLCAEFGVRMALAAGAMPSASCATAQRSDAGRWVPAEAGDARPILWIDPRHLNRLARVPGPRPLWRAEPGVTLGQLAAAGLPQFTHAEPGRMLADWFADRSAAAWPTGRGDFSGIHAAEVMLADGAVDRLGPFGAQDGEPLRTAALQRLVPELFRLASSTQAEWCRTQPAWPACYRIDALVPCPPASINLAQALHGHGGSLVWLESLALTVPAGEERPALASPPPPPQARALDARVKEAFDPAGIFGPFRAASRAHACTGVT
ncbi:hypothetical protein CAL14_16705 [Bordetella genomosp. 9]|uniref:hypothetical protein n=1 Tax=Bordetella genomosp. 9 TaxID=1416803 RepID=UPI000A290F01|nr:hypothetical protein [Bordetella genomosp. 9]ARP91727.1 hypothetical protein CAL14_16705 [Bordetella genomosp. 9]